MSARECLKIYSDNVHVPLCGIFGSNSVSIARYIFHIGAKSLTNCDAHLAESNLQTRSNAHIINHKCPLFPTYVFPQSPHIHNPACHPLCPYRLACPISIILFMQAFAVSRPPPVTFIVNNRNIFRI